MTARRFPVCPAAELPVGARRLVDVPGVGTVGVFNVNGSYHALKSQCPHQGAQLCKGKLTGTAEPTFDPGALPGIRWTREGEILRCPWHGWEFDIRTGKALCGEHWRVATYEVEVPSVRGGPFDVFAGWPAGAAVDAVRDRFGSRALTRAAMVGRELAPAVPLLPD